MSAVASYRRSPVRLTARQAEGLHRLMQPDGDSRTAHPPHEGDPPRSVALFEVGPPIPFDEGRVPASREEEFDAWLILVFAEDGRWWQLPPMGTAWPQEGRLR